MLKRLKHIGPGAMVAAAFIGPGTVTTATLTLNFLTLPAILLGFLFGILIVKRIKDDLYRRLVLLLTVLASIALFF